MPDLVLVDGGAGQLSAAHAELVKLGLDDVAAAGLAKRFEELYRLGSRHPVRLPATSSALKVLQRIRDEAHRFALTYHRHLRNKRMRESILDEIPGIGAKRKKQLLERFGSIRQIIHANEEAIAALPGFGHPMAKIIKSYIGAAE